MANKQTRGVARGLFPVRLEENGLISALEELAENTGSFFNTRCGFTCESPVTIHDHTVAHHLYYIAQEAILNAVKHAKARSIEVQLAAANGEGCVLTVRDDGVGLNAAPAQARGMGLRIMNYRARMIGAELQLGLGRQGGTEVVCRLLREARFAS
jgi:signal transduction histidine kinase